MISSRFSIPVYILLALALVPTVIHSYIAAVDHDGLDSAEISTHLAGFTSEPTKRPQNWGQSTYDSFDWFERRYQNAAGTQVRLFVARSYDVKKLYHHPELAVLHGVDLVAGKGKPLAIGSDQVPVHVLNGSAGQGVAAYVLLYDDQYVENPVKFQLQTALKLLSSQRKPMTLFFAYDESADPAVSFEDSSVARILTSAITSFRAQTP